MSDKRRLVTVLGFLFLASMAGRVFGQGALAPSVQNVPDVKFGAFPGMPTCSTGSVLSGNPAKGSSIILAKMKAGCVFPWHWHTPNEHVMMVSGSARAEMKDAKPFTLHAGGFALMPSHHAHRFECTKACLLYVYSDAAFDLHYVDEKGQEIPPDEALKKVKETAAKPSQ